jgi:hypothetical protein
MIALNILFPLSSVKIWCLSHVNPYMCILIAIGVVMGLYLHDHMLLGYQEILYLLSFWFFKFLSYVCDKMH